MPHGALGRAGYDAAQESPWTSLDITGSLWTAGLELPI
jgi:hypothetical protein